MGIPNKIVKIVQLTLNKTKATMLMQGTRNNYFKINSGV